MRWKGDSRRAESYSQEGGLSIVEQSLIEGQATRNNISANRRRVKNYNLH